MRRRPRTGRLIAEINITPFTDVILVLLIIFMVATPLLLQSNIEVKLPQAKSGQPVANIKQAMITITDDGLVYLDKTLVTKKELKQGIAAFQKQNPQARVFFRIDKLVRFQDIVEVMDVLNELGVSNLSIAVTSK